MQEKSQNNRNFVKIGKLLKAFLVSSVIVGISPAYAQDASKEEIIEDSVVVADQLLKCSATHTENILVGEAMKNNMDKWYRVAGWFFTAGVVLTDEETSKKLQQKHIAEYRAKLSEATNAGGRENEYKLNRYFANLNVDLADCEMLFKKYNSSPLSDKIKKYLSTKQ